MHDQLWALAEPLGELYDRGCRDILWTAIPARIRARCETHAVPVDQAVLDLQFLRGRGEASWPVFLSNWRRYADLAGESAPPVARDPGRQDRREPPLEVLGVYLDDALPKAEARLALELYLGESLPDWLVPLDPRLGREGLTAVLDGLNARLTPRAPILMILDRVLDRPGTQYAAERVHPARKALEDWYQDLTATERPEPIIIRQTSYPPRDGGPSLAEKERWSTRLSWPLARKRFADPDAWLPFARYLPPGALPEPEALRPWLREVAVIAPRPALLAHWQRRPVDGARTVNLLRTLCPRGGWHLHADAPVPLGLRRQPTRARPEGLSRLRIGARDGTAQALDLFGACPPAALVVDGQPKPIPKRIPFHPDAVVFDLSPLPEWLAGRAAR